MKIKVASLLALALMAALSPAQNVPRKLGTQSAKTQPSHVQAPSPPALRLTAGFIPFWNNMASSPPNDRPKAEWCGVLKKMRDVHMDNVVIQRLVYRDSEGREWPFMRPKDHDPTEMILKCADELKMSVYIGLWEDPSFGDSNISAGYFDGPQGVTAKTIEVAKRAWERYSGHKSFVGWYVPLEPWNIYSASADELDRKIRVLNGFYSAVSGACKQFEPKNVAAKKRVAVAAFFNPSDDPTWLAPAEKVAAVYTKILKQSGVDVLMLQDGVGVRGSRDPKWEDDLSGYLAHVERYFAAFGEACRRAEPAVEFWGLLENFEKDESTGAVVPADLGRIKDQFRHEWKAVPSSKFVVFDFYHYMNPVVPDITVDGFPLTFGRFKDRERLYTAYKAEFISKAFRP